MAKTKFVIEVTYDEQVTDPESLSNAFDSLLDMAMSTPGILEDYGEVRAGGFYVLGAGDATGPHCVIMSSSEFGDEEFKYDTRAEAEEGLLNLIRNASVLNDGIERSFRIVGPVLVAEEGAGDE